MTESACFIDCFCNKINEKSFADTNSFILPNLHVENYFQFKCDFALILDVVFSYKKI